MREYINANLRVIRADLKKRTKKLSKLNSDSIREEFKEWNDPLFDKELIWTLPDLTRIDRYKIFVDQLKKRLDKDVSHLSEYHLFLNKSNRLNRQYLISRQITRHLLAGQDQIF